MPRPLIRARAQLVIVHGKEAYLDGDTYDFLLDTLNTGFKVGAQTLEVRLRDFSCPERGTAAGKRARAVALELLREAREILVELKGERSFARQVGWVWVDDEALGPLLVEAGVARPGAFEG